MSATFTPLEANVGAINMNGQPDLVLCRINVTTGATTSDVLPPDWTSQVQDNVVKLTPYTSTSSRYTRSFASLLMEVVEATGEHTAHIVPSRDRATLELVLTLVAGSANDAILINIPRSSEAGFLINPPGGDGAGGPVDVIDQNARDGVDALQGVVENLKTKVDALAEPVDISQKADISYVQNNFASTTALNAKADKVYVDDTFAKKTDIPDFTSKADKVYVDDTFAKKTDIPAPLDTSTFAVKVDVDAALNLKADKTDIPNVSGFAVKTDVDAALALKADKTALDLKADKTDLTPLATISYVNAQLGNVTAGSVTQTQLNTAIDGVNSTIHQYSADPAGGLTMSADYAFSAGSTVVRTPNGAVAADAGKAPVVQANGSYALVAIPDKTYVDNLAAGVKYKDAVKKTFSAKPAASADLTGLAANDRFLVNASPASVDNGIWVVTTVTPFAIARPTDFDNEDVSGAYVFDIGGGTSYICTTAKGSAVAGTNTLTFAQYSAGQSYSAAANGGLLLGAQNQFSVDFATANDLPIKDGQAAAVGNGTRAARWNHVHPTDDSRAPLNSPVFTGVPQTAQPVALSVVNNELVTAAWVTAKVQAAAAAGVSSVLINGNSSAYLTVTPGTGTGSVTIGATVGAAGGLAAYNDTRFPKTAPATSGKYYWGTAPTGGTALDWQTLPAQLPTAAKGALLYGDASTTSAWAALAAGTANQVLVWDSTGVPKWASVPGGVPTPVTTTDDKKVLTANAVGGYAWQVAPVVSVNNKTGAVTLVASDIGAAPLDSPTFTGTPTRPALGATPGDTELATVKFVNDKVAAAKGVPYDIAVMIPGTPTASTGTTGATISWPYRFIATRAFTLAASGHQGGTGTAPTATTTFTLYYFTNLAAMRAALSGTLPAALGTITCNTDGTVAFAITTQAVIAGGILMMACPTAVNAVSDIFVTLAATLA